MLHCCIIMLPQLHAASCLTHNSGKPKGRRTKSGCARPSCGYTHQINRHRPSGVPGDLFLLNRHVEVVLLLVAGHYAGKRLIAVNGDDNRQPAHLAVHEPSPLNIRHEAPVGKNICSPRREQLLEQRNASREQTPQPTGRHRTERPSVPKLCVLTLPVPPVCMCSPSAEVGR